TSPRPPCRSRVACFSPPVSTPGCSRPWRLSGSEPDAVIERNRRPSRLEYGRMAWQTMTTILDQALPADDQGLVGLDWGSSCFHLIPPRASPAAERKGLPVVSTFWAAALRVSVVVTCSLAFCIATASSR